jgi:hypothetical protein
MALTFSNRETFLVLQWLEGRPERHDFFRKLAKTLAAITTETAVPRLADAILAELESELPKLDGIAGEMLQSGLRRVAFYELALALVLETGATLGQLPEPACAARWQ